MPKRFTKEEFIEKAKQVHGERFDYSEVEYVNNNIKVLIRCNICGNKFGQIPRSHLSGIAGCKYCADKNKSLSTEEFIERAKRIHSDKYNYSRVNYINYGTKVCIICPEHGEFWQFPGSHLDGAGCRLCSFEKRRKTTEEFIEQAKQIHGDKYDYSKVEYITENTKVLIHCNVCGNDFEQTPNAHLAGKGCIKCAGIIKKTTEEFIEQAKQIHGDKYDYSKVEYINTDTPVCIICPKHGEFWQAPKKHLKGCNCPKCSNNVKKTTEEFIEQAKQIHGDKYDYSEVEYIDSCTPVRIFCKKHKSYFLQLPKNHLKGQGCKKCKETYGEKKIAKFLDKYDINYIYDATCLEFLGKLRPDFYLPEYNLIIEYDGEQHFRPVNFGGINDEEAKLEFEKVKERDDTKNRLCEENSIEVLRISYIDFENIENILKKRFGCD